jgi:hypothetical protein
MPPRRPAVGKCGLKDIGDQWLRSDHKRLPGPPSERQPRYASPLSDFRSWGLNSATVKRGSTSGVISTFPDDEITMVDSRGNVEAQPGAVNSSGNAFTDTWHRST